MNKAGGCGKVCFRILTSADRSSFDYKIVSPESYILRGNSIAQGPASLRNLLCDLYLGKSIINIYLMKWKGNGILV